jgi:hypothetical protein
LISLRNGSYWWAVEAVIGVFSGGLAVFLIVPLLLRGSWFGLLVALIYWGVGRVINPLLYLFPQNWLGSERDGVSILLYGIHIFWWLVMLVGIVGFFFLRRSSRLSLTPNQRA